MTSKRNFEKRLERLEAQQEMKRTAQESFDEAVVDVIIEFATHRLSGASDSLPADVVASLPAGFLEQYEALNGDGGN